MHPGRKKLQDGDFNIMNVELLPGGPQRVTIYKYGEKKVYKMVAKDLYLPTEEITDEEEVDLDWPSRSTSP